MTRKSELEQKNFQQANEITRLKQSVDYHKTNADFYEERWVETLNDLNNQAMEATQPYDQEEESVNLTLEELDAAEVDITNLADLLGELILPEEIISPEAADKAALAVGAVILMLENKASSIAVRTGDSFAALFEEYTDIALDVHDLRQAIVIDGDNDEFWAAATALYESLVE